MGFKRYLFSVLLLFGILFLFSIPVRSQDGHVHKKGEIHQHEQLLSDFTKSMNADPGEEIVCYRAYHRNFYLIILSVSLLSILLMGYGYGQKRKHNRLLSEKNEEITAKNKYIESRNLKIREINDEINASIRYSLRIQKGLLPTKSELKEDIGSHFLMYRPLHIVSGDFYCSETIGDKTIIAAVDCTGHGVPGGFMSIIGMTSIRHVLATLDEICPNKILQGLHQQLLHTLHHHENGTSDGMDCSICVIDRKSRTMKFAGAKSSIYLVQDGKGEKYKGNSGYLGSKDHADNCFDIQEINLGKQVSLYLFSDGFQDQFGGEKNKKFGFKRMKEKFNQLHTLPMQDQKLSLEKMFDEWKGEEPQTDDVLLLGIDLSENV